MAKIKTARTVRQLAAAKSNIAAVNEKLATTNVKIGKDQYVARKVKNIEKLETGGFTGVIKFGKQVLSVFKKPHSRLWTVQTAPSAA